MKISQYIGNSRQGFSISNNKTSQLKILKSFFTNSTHVVIKVEVTFLMPHNLLHAAGLPKYLTVPHTLCLGTNVLFSIKSLYLLSWSLAWGKLTSFRGCLSYLAPLSMQSWPLFSRFSCSEFVLPGFSLICCTWLKGTSCWSIPAACFGSWIDRYISNIPIHMFCLLVKKLCYNDNDQIDIHSKDKFGKFSWTDFRVCITLTLFHTNTGKT